MMLSRRWWWLNDFPLKWLFDVSPLKNYYDSIYSITVRTYIQQFIITTAITYYYFSFLRCPVFTSVQVAPAIISLDYNPTNTYVRILLLLAHRNREQGKTLCEHFARHILALYYCIKWAVVEIFAFYEEEAATASLGRHYRCEPLFKLIVSWFVV